MIGHVGSGPGVELMICKPKNCRPGKEDER
jgi:hypothetical protein